MEVAEAAKKFVNEVEWLMWLRQWKELEDEVEKIRVAICC